jgi:hypothetical protein
MTIDEMIEEEKKGVGMERLTDKNVVGNYFYPKCFRKCDGLGASSKCDNCELTTSVCEKLGKYEDLEEQGRLIKVPCKVGDTVYVASSILPIKNIEHYEDVDDEVPAYFTGRVVSFRFAKRNWIKIAVKAKWLHEWIDDETGPESNYIKSEKYFTVILSSIGKTVFLSKQEAETKLKN